MNRFDNPLNDEPDLERLQEMADLRADYLRDDILASSEVSCLGKTKMPNTNRPSQPNHNANSDSPLIGAIPDLTIPKSFTVTGQTMRDILLKPYFEL
jgi:hypothetical protein